MPLILGTNSIKDTGYDVANSVRYNDGDSPKLNINFGSDGTLNKWTFSMWFKRSTLGTAQRLFCVLDSGMDDYIKFDTSDQLEWTFDHEDGSNRGVLKTNRKFRDVSAWYHLVCRLDTTDSTAGDRMRMYINGTEETSFATDTNPTLNETGDIGRDNNHYIGTSGSSQYFDGYIAEVCMINNQSLEPTSFGEFDSDSPNIWKPIDISGLTPGTNGFFLDFEDSSNLGNDAFGGTDWTETNLAATDQTTDTCTNNFATLNPLMNNVNNLPTLSEGNLEVLAVSGSTWSVTPSTIGLPKKGKWVFEVEAVSGTSGDRAAFAGWMNPAVSNPLANGSILWRNVASTNSILSNDSAATGSFSATTWGTDGHIIGMYIDMDNSKMYFTHNGTVQNSGTGIDFQGTFDDDTFILPVVMVINTDKLSVNFGNPASNFAIASGNSDPNGYGNFEYSTTITGDGSSKSFYAICTKNLAEYG
jgi:hypothetical protein